MSNVHTKKYQYQGLNIESYENIKLNECFYEVKLDNGLKVFLIKKEGFKKFECTLSVKFGSMHNHFKVDDVLFDAPLGVAHFLEHMKFKSQKEEEIFDTFDNLSLELNAYTCSYETCYYFSGNKNFYIGLDKFIDFILTPYFTDENVKSESDVILQEYYESYNPNVILDRELENALVKENEHKYEIVGTPESIKKITKEDLYYCYNTFYHPENMKMYIIGDFDPFKLFVTINNKFNERKFTKRPNVSIITKFEDNLVNYHYKEIEYGINVPKVAIGIKFNYVDDVNYEDYLRKEIYMRMMLSYVFNNKTKFFKKLNKLGLIESEISRDFVNEDGICYLYLIFNSFKAEEAIDAILNKVRELKDYKNSKNNFSNIKRMYIAQFYWDLASTLSNELSVFRFYDLQNVNYFRILDIINKIDYDECHKYYQELFGSEITDDNISIVTMK